MSIYLTFRIVYFNILRNQNPQIMSIGKAPSLVYLKVINIFRKEDKYYSIINYANSLLNTVPDFYFITNFLHMHNKL